MICPCCKKRELEKTKRGLLCRECHYEVNREMPVAFSIPLSDPMTPDYTNATADVLTAATLAKPEAKKAAVKAVLESYFPATGETHQIPAIVRNMKQGEIGLLVQADGSVEHWEGTTYRATYRNIADAVSVISKLP